MHITQSLLFNAAVAYLQHCIYAKQNLLRIQFVVFPTSELISSQSRSCNHRNFCHKSKPLPSSPKMSHSKSQKVELASSLCQSLYVVKHCIYLFIFLGKSRCSLSVKKIYHRNQIRFRAFYDSFFFFNSLRKSQATALYF